MCIYLLQRAGRQKVICVLTIEYSSIEIITSKISKILFTQQIKRTLVRRGPDALAVIHQASPIALIHTTLKMTSPNKSVSFWKFMPAQEPYRHVSRNGAVLWGPSPRDCNCSSKQLCISIENCANETGNSSPCSKFVKQF